MRANRAGERAKAPEHIKGKSVPPFRQGRCSPVPPDREPGRFAVRPFLALGTAVASVLLRCDADEALLGRIKDGEWNGDRLQRAIARYARIGPPVADDGVRRSEKLRA